MSNRQQLGSIKILKLHTHIHLTAYHKLVSTDAVLPHNS